MLKFFAAAALIGAGLLVDGSEAQAGLFRKCKKSQHAPTACCATSVAPATYGCGTTVVGAPTQYAAPSPVVVPPTVMPKTR